MNDNIDKLHIMSEALLKYETLNADQITEIMEGKELTPPKNWDEEDDGNKPKTDTKKKSKDPKKTVIGGEATES